MDKNTFKNQKANADFLPTAQIIGNYIPKGGDYYQNETNDLLIKVCSRKQPTALKPQFYIVNRTPENKFVFLTSLYPLKEPNMYRAEIKHNYFIVNYTDSTLNIVNS